MPELVDLFLAVPGSDECHFGDQDLGLEHGRAVVQPLGRAVADVGDARHAPFLSHFGAGQSQVANLVARQILELGL